VKYIPYQQIGDRPCIVVDGQPHPSALITLSHWPWSGTPKELQDDSSTQIALRYLESARHHVDAQIVSNDHFDEDGLASLFVILHPDAALERRELLRQFASAGDFGCCDCPAAARAAFTISAFADPERSPLGKELFSGEEAPRVAALYEELLGRMPEIIDHPERYEEMWREEDEIFTADQEAVRSGLIRIEEQPELDLAVVHLPLDVGPRRVHRYAQVRNLRCHPMAIFNATRCMRVLSIQGQRYELEYRYESWVQYISSRPLPRVDITPLAEELTAIERSGGRWIFDGVSELTPRLHLTGAEESSLEPLEFRAMLERFLVTAPPAWNPYSRSA
jgi:hypothetical protein